MEHFSALREFALSLTSTEDARSRLVDAIDMMSQVNNDYIGISIAKDETLRQLKKTIKAANEKQLDVEKAIHECQIKADNNLANVPDEFDPKGLKFLPLDESEIPELSEAERVEFRMLHDFEIMPQMKERQRELEERRQALKKQLDEARAVYGSILNKMRGMYDSLVSFQKK